MRTKNNMQSSHMYSFKFLKIMSYTFWSIICVCLYSCWSLCVCLHLCFCLCFCSLFCSNFCLQLIIFLFPFCSLFCSYLFTFCLHFCLHFYIHVSWVTCVFVKFVAYIYVYILYGNIVDGFCLRPVCFLVSSCVFVYNCIFCFLICNFC